MSCTGSVRPPAVLAEDPYRRSMRSRRPTSEHQEAVSRRLASLRAELTAERPEDPGEWWQEHTRVPSRERDQPVVTGQFDPDQALDAAPMVPIPGRHASRRTGRMLVQAVPATLRGRLALGPGQLTVVAVLVALGMAVTCWWVVRGDASQAAAPVAVATSPAGELIDAPDVPVVPAATEAGTSVTVDVAGRVRHPGIAVLKAGSRVVDALEAAGGPRPGVDLAGVNLARLLIDGEQILVGRAPAVGTAASATPPPGAPGGPLINLNVASQTELETLPEVGPVTAQSIITWRDQHGGFTAIDELLEVDGIGETTLGQLAPYVTV